jgi:hypothetical protein
MPAASGGAMASMRLGSEGGGVAALKALVIGMGVLILAGTVMLAVLVVQRLSGERAAGAPFRVSLGPADGARIAGVAATDRALAIWVSRPDGERILLLDPASGRPLGELRFGE